MMQLKKHITININNKGVSIRNRVCRVLGTLCSPFSGQPLLTLTPHLYYSYSNR